MSFRYKPMSQEPDEAGRGADVVRKERRHRAAERARAPVQLRVARVVCTLESRSSKSLTAKWEEQLWLMLLVPRSPRL